MALGPDSLVLCSGTLPFDTSLSDRIEAAAAGGFDGLSLWVRDIDRGPGVATTLPERCPPGARTLIMTPCQCRCREREANDVCRR